MYCTLHSTACYARWPLLVSKDCDQARAREPNVSSCESTKKRRGTSLLLLSLTISGAITSAETRYTSPARRSHDSSHVPSTVDRIWPIPAHTVSTSMDMIFCWVQIQSKSTTFSMIVDGARQARFRNAWPQTNHQLHSGSKVPLKSHCSQ